MKKLDIGLIKWDSEKSCEASPKMTKQELKDGMILETREGKRFLLTNGLMRGRTDFDRLSHYDDDLLCVFRGTTYREFDIVKVYKDSNCYSLADVFKDENLTLIWERKEIKLTEQEVEVLKALKTLGLEWLARDRSGILYTYESKPLKQSLNMWLDGDGYHFSIKKDVIVLDFIKWEDTKPTNIDDLLKMV